MLLAPGSTAAPGRAGDERVERGHCRSRKKKKATAEQGLIPPHSRSLVSGDQLCSLHPTNLAARFALCLGHAGVLWSRQLHCAASARGAGPAQGIIPPSPAPRKAVSPSPHVLAQPDRSKGAAAQLAQRLVSRVEQLSFPHGLVASCGDHRQETLQTSLNALRLHKQLRTAVLWGNGQTGPHGLLWPRGGTRRSQLWRCTPED